MTVSSRVYDLLFESKLHLLNKPSALCKLSFALVNDKLQEAEEDNEQSLSRCYDYHFYDDKWLSFWNDLWLSFWEPSRFYWTKSDRNGSETQSESRDEQGIIPRVNKESVRNEGSHTPLTVGVLCPAELSF